MDLSPPNLSSSSPKQRGSPAMSDGHGRVNTHGSSCLAQGCCTMVSGLFYHSISEQMFGRSDFLESSADHKVPSSNGKSAVMCYVSSRNISPRGYAVCRPIGVDRRRAEQQRKALVMSQSTVRRCAYAVRLPAGKSDPKTGLFVESEQRLLLVTVAGIHGRV